jgi:hypothetical protein
MQRTSRLWFLLATVVALLAVAPLAFAQDAQFKGRIKAASVKHITVATARDPRITIRIGEQTSITVNGIPASGRQLKPGYRVRVEAARSEFGGLEAVTIQASH